MYTWTTSSWVSSASSWTIQTTCVTTVSTGLALEEPLVVAWRDEHLLKFPTEYASSLAKRIGITLPTNTASSISTPPSPPLGTSTPSLSTGSKAGIGIDAAIGAIAILGAVMSLSLRHRRKMRAAERPQEYNKAELDGQDQNMKKHEWWLFSSEAENQSGRHGLDSRPMHAEANALSSPTELEHQPVHIVPGPPAELDGTTARRLVDNEHDLDRVTQSRGG
ncbi:hypothetical protein E8E11_001068 [Didymella keratinophila]|nr:hypothetical protein E8E11_001068 [Didymella keratinophila]